MKFSCEQGQLNNGVSIVSRSAALKSAEPSKEGILLEVTRNYIRLAGNNGDLAVVTTLEGDVYQEGSIVVASKLFSDIIRKLPNQKVDIHVDNYQMSIVCGAAEFRLSCLNAEDFPEIPVVPTQLGVELPQATLKHMISGTHFAVSNNFHRPIHTGTLFEVEENVLTMVSVDGYRLALREEEVTEVIGGGGDFAFSFVVAGAALTEVEKLCSGDGMVSIYSGTNHTLFRCDRGDLISRSLDGEFLEYNNTIPSTYEYQIKIQRKDFLNAIDRASLMISEKTKTPLHCRFDNDVVYMSSKTSMGEAKDICPVEGDGENIEIGFNHRFLYEGLRYAPHEVLRICFTTDVGPCLLLPEDEDDDSYCYMVLPVRLKTD